jgi:hypothetical protein
MKLDLTTYKIKITPITKNHMCAAKPHVIEITTGDLEWSMEQYHRNRDPFTWEILEQDGNKNN